MTYPPNVLIHPSLRLLEYRSRLRTAQGRERARLLVEIGRWLARSSRFDRSTRASSRASAGAGPALIEVDGPSSRPPASDPPADARR